MQASTFANDEMEFETLNKGHRMS